MESKMWKKIVDIGLNSFQIVSDKLNNYSVKEMHMINFVCIYLCVLFTLFLAGWLYQWAFLHVLDLDMLLKGVNVLGSAGVLAVIRYVTDKISNTKIIIDRNNNGIPDDEEGYLPPRPRPREKESDMNVYK
jgi:hypothetical protein